MPNEGISHECAAGSRKLIKDYAAGNSSSTLRRHLACDHINTWVSICKQKGITIEAKVIAKKLDAYHNTHDQSVKQDNGTTCQKYSREAFVNVIVEWIVTDDQVH